MFPDVLISNIPSQIPKYSLTIGGVLMVMGGTGYYFYDLCRRMNGYIPEHERPGGAPDAGTQQASGGGNRAFAAFTGRNRNQVNDNYKH